MHTSGEFLTHKPTRLPVGMDAQKTGSAITYARRYSLMAALGLATEDDDGASAPPRKERTPVRDTPPAEFKTADKVNDERTRLLTEVGKLRNVNSYASRYTEDTLNTAKVKVVSQLDDDALKALRDALEDMQYLPGD